MSPRNNTPTGTGPFTGTGSGPNPNPGPDALEAAGVAHGCAAAAAGAGTGAGAASSTLDGQPGVELVQERMTRSSEALLTDKALASYDNIPLNKDLISKKVAAAPSRASRAPGPGKIQQQTAVAAGASSSVAGQAPQPMTVSCNLVGQGKIPPRAEGGPGESAAKQTPPPTFTVTDSQGRVTSEVLVAEGDIVPPSPSDDADEHQAGVPRRLPPIGRGLASQAACSTARKATPPQSSAGGGPSGLDSPRSPLDGGRPTSSRPPPASPADFARELFRSSTGQDVPSAW